MRFQKFFLIWVAGTILEGWEAELEMDPFMCIQSLKQEVCINFCDLSQFPLKCDISIPCEKKVVAIKLHHFLLLVGYFWILSTTLYFTSLVKKHQVD